MWSRRPILSSTARAYDRSGTTADAKSRSTTRSRISSSLRRCTVAVIWVIKSAITRICGRKRTIIRTRVFTSVTLRPTKYCRQWWFLHLSNSRRSWVVKWPLSQRPFSRANHFLITREVLFTRIRLMSCQFSRKLSAVNRNQTRCRVSIAIRSRRRANSRIWISTRHPSNLKRDSNPRLLPDHWTTWSSPSASQLTATAWIPHGRSTRAGNLSTETTTHPRAGRSETSDTWHHRIPCETEATINGECRPWNANSVPWVSIRIWWTAKSQTCTRWLPKSTRT